MDTDGVLLFINRVFCQLAIKLVLIKRPTSLIALATWRQADRRLGVETHGTSRSSPLNRLIVLVRFNLVVELFITDFGGEADLEIFVYHRA